MAFRNKVGRLLSKAMKVIGEPVIYISKTSGRCSIRGVYDDGFESVDPETETLISSNELRLGLKMADLPHEPKPDDRIYIPRLDQYFAVIDPQKDGHGGITLQLHEE